jgi:very-short-patch-repair endonuclease
MPTHNAARPADGPADGPKTADIEGFSAHRRGSSVEGRLGALAAAQHGCVSLEQMLALGLSERAVHQRVTAGRLHRVHQRVYSLEPELRDTRARFMAAVLACGPGAILSHRSAGELWGILEPRDDEDAPIHVFAPNRRGRSPAGIAAHRNRSLASGDRTVLHGIRCTTVSRTLLDFAAEASIKELKRAVAQAEVRGILRHSLAREQIRRNRGRRGVARFRLVLDSIHPDTKRTRSELEVMFLELCSTASLPRPEVNTRLRVAADRRLEVDFLWRQARLVVEADSRRFHDTDSAFLTDRQREQALQLAGWRVSHCTWEQVEREPRALAETVRGLIARA